MTPVFQKPELTEAEIERLRNLLVSEDWAVVAKVRAVAVENLRGMLEMAAPDQVSRLQGILYGLRDLEGRLKAAVAPPNEQEAEREAYEHLGRSFGRDATGGY